MSVLCRHGHSKCNGRAGEVLARKKRTGVRKITMDDVLYVLSTLPQPKNTRRTSVIQMERFCALSVGRFDDSKGRAPTLSSLCTSCPLLVTVLSQFVLDHDRISLHNNNFEL